MKTVLLPKRLAGVGAAVAGLVLCFAGAAVGQQTTYEPWIPVPVTFFDFHSDRSNPEFEQPHGKASGGIRPNMVQNLLDDDSLPMANPPSGGGYLNQGIRFWFRDWSNLGRYLMAGSAKKDPIDNSRQYLEKFRPVYKYGTLDPPAIEMRAQGNCGGSPCWTASEWDNNDYQWVKNAYDPGDFTGVISNSNTGIENAFENRVTKASLKFKHTGGGVYEFSQVNFFPLDAAVAVGGSVSANGYNDGVTFENGMTPLTTRKWSSTNGTNAAHNYSFTMMMFQQFKMEPGLTFDFRGDDDVWLFINNRLVKGSPGVDLGGIHSAVEGRVRLDDIKVSHGLQDGKAYNFHLFYAERHSDESNIRIMTNIVTARLTGLIINAHVDTLIAGQKSLVYAIVMTDTGSALRDYTNGTFTWTAKDIGPTKNGTAVAGQQVTVTNKSGGPTTNKSDSVYVMAIKAYTWVRIKGQYYDDKLKATVVDSIDVWVKAGAPTKLWVEASDDSTQALRAAKPLDTVRINGTATFNEGFYAIMRDQYENWVGTAKTPISWLVPAAQQTIATAKSGTNVNRGQGRAERAAGANSGTAPFTVSYTHNGTALTGNGVIKLENVIYQGIEIGIKQGGTFITKSSSTDNKIEMVVGADTTLWVRLKRPDGTWEEAVPVNWTQSNVPGVTNPTGSLVSWKITPNAPTTNGTVTATIPAGSGTGSATVNIVVKYNDPVTARFFYMTGTPVFGNDISTLVGARPTTARKYVEPSAYVDLVAGEPMPIVGKVFASTNISAGTWLDPNAPNSSVKAGKWTWAFVPGSAAGSRPGGKNEGITTNDGVGGGDSMSFKSTLATYDDYVKIRGTYTDNTKSPTISLSYDIWIRVIPDVSKAKLHIEPDQNGRAISPTSPRDLSELVFNKSEGTGTTKTIYAVIRDTYGNYICQSGASNPYPPPSITGATAWTVSAPQSVSAEVGYAEWGEGRITRLESKDTKVKASNTAWGTDAWAEIPVKFVDFDYKDIQIVEECTAGSGNQIAGTKYCEVVNVVMTSNDDKKIFVIGQRDDNDKWEDITGDWGRDPGLMEALGTPPSGSNSWTLTPDASGKGKITVVKGGKTDEVDVTITVGPPIRAELVILTPLDEIVAGKDITAIVQYYNRAGLMTEWNPAWRSPGAWFADTLGNGKDKGVKVDPKVKSVVGTLDLCYLGISCPTQNAVLAHKVSDLSDTVKFVIYYATSGHQIRYKEEITVGGTTIPLTAVSVPFTVKAGEAANIEIYGPDGKLDEHLDVKFTDPELILRAVAEDEWGNKIGDYPSNWNATVPIPVNEANRPVIVYVPGKAEEQGCGKLVVTGVANPSLKDEVEICLTGVNTTPVSAFTRDADGCGYLDRIDMKFKKAIYFKGGETNGRKPTANELSVVYSGFTFDIDSVTVNPKDSTVSVWLNDVVGSSKHSGALQTDWLPTITIADAFLWAKRDGGALDTVYWQTVKEPVVIDGAAPVIATAKLHMQDNYVTVKFSEKIKASQSTFLTAGDTRYPPSILFNIWLKRADNAALKARTQALTKKKGDVNEAGPWELQIGKLDGIDKVFRKDDYTLRFDLKDDIKINPTSDYINIRTSDQAVEKVEITELRGVADIGIEPKANNRKVLITPEGEPNGVMKPVPNPASPDDSRVGTYGTSTPGVTVTKPIGAGKIYAVHDLTALEQVRGSKDPATGKYKPGEKGGAVFAVPIYVPKKGYVKCQLKIYDLAGNLVISGESGKKEDAAAGLPDDLRGLPNATDIHLYWNGYNSKAMKVAPGTYRIVVKISYPEDGNLAPEDKQFAKEQKYTGLLGMSK